MATLNTKKEGFRSKAHLNWMGGPSYFLKSPVHTLRMAAASCFFGEPKYYEAGEDGKRNFRKRTSGYDAYGRETYLSDAALKHLNSTLDRLDPQEWRGLNSSQMMEKAIDAALDFDVEATLALAAELRNDWNIRTTPQVILVRAANHPKAKGTPLVRRFARDIVKRADEPSVGLAYQFARYGKRKIPNSLKRAYRDFFASASEYSLAKYRMEDRVVKTVDVVNLVRPTRTPAVDGLVRGTLKTTGKTWESIRSAGGTWEEAIDVMGHMALLRNLRNFHQNKVDPKLFLPKLKATVRNGKQLPFRYYSAYNALRQAGASPVLLDGVEEALMESLQNLPQFGGRVMSLCDNSGSAWGAHTSSAGTMPIATIANLTGVLTGMVAEEGYVGAFGDRLDVMPVRKRSSVFDQLTQLNLKGGGVGGGTEHGIWLFWDQAIKKKEHWDRVFVYSDMQAGHGGLFGTGGYRDYIWQRSGNYIDVPKLINTYRQKVNPDVQVFLVQVAGYQDTIVPEFYDKTYILGGWSDGLLRFAHEMSRPQPQQ